MDKDRARTVARFDQATELVAETLVPLIARYYRGLVESGVPESAATEITIAYQMHLVNLAMGNEEGESDA